MPESPKQLHTPFYIEENVIDDDYPYLEISTGEDGTKSYNRIVALVQPELNDKTEKFEITTLTISRGKFIITACNSYYQNQMTIKELKKSVREAHKLCSECARRNVELQTALSKLKDDKS